jgi:hypothetical protein
MRFINRFTKHAVKFKAPTRFALSFEGDSLGSKTNLMPHLVLATLIWNVEDVHDTSKGGANMVK